ncbi:DUF3160 domain-containing protein [Methanosarcina sp.]|uniref:DUF3160 domain-containing protein n=1 Tax=Methanosarcina sp. TaxID=2213 RepID=UPI00298988C8|nr:DUF3160 domain-containing protein [Methanosarcina sp.]MDW5549574.1 DUF3160 domain-containing protein [Methanosarcina sp.]MDW5553606.1 DUF3160 domain-containing protein [Methanosarcina sp.]MDW5558588.1 DUF3160 domain-containing protein [Methanosarcina sp.]
MRELIVICLLIVSLILESGCIGSSSEPVKETKLVNETKFEDKTNSQTSSYNSTEKDVSVENSSEKSKNSLTLEGQSSFSNYYNKKSLQFEAAVPTYSLPLQDSEIANYYQFTQKIPLTNEERDLLYKNGFIVIENKTTENLLIAGKTLVNETYLDLKVADVPIFITSDSLLHLYHIQFDETLKRVETEEFYDDLWKLDKTLLEASIEDYDSASGTEKEAARRNIAYFAVALSLLEPKPEQIAEDSGIAEENTPFYSGNAKDYSVEVPSFVKDDVEAELNLIEAHEGSALSPIFKYSEDYSQYIPRGHYTNSEILKNYFRAMMWHGRMSMLLQSDVIAAENSENEAKTQTIQALLISDHFDRDKDLQARWNRIYRVTAFYVGFSDDLGPYQYAKVLDTVFGNDRNGVSFDNESLTALKTELEKYESPKIYSGTGGIIQEGSETENKTLEATKGFRFIGQRYTPDSYIFQKLHPPALNIMDLLGSQRAREHLKNQGISENEEYKKAHTSLENEFGAFDEEDWNKNLYWAQLYALKPLLVSYPEGYPTFMQTEAWEDKQLNTALASWTELRHDTILYAKQEYFTGPPQVPPEEKPVQGYVEPVPEFYARMLALTKMAHTGLTEMEVLDMQSDEDFTTLENTLEKLLEISIKELENKELTDKEYKFIRNFGQNIAPMLDNVDRKSQNSILVADVCTSPAGVLEEGTGKLNLIVVAYKQPDGRIVLGAGPVMSYYEFWQPPGQRLTDEEWRDMLENNPPERPDWVKSFKV